jgi:hypothetical protein
MAMQPALEKLRSPDCHRRQIGATYGHTKSTKYFSPPPYAEKSHVWLIGARGQSMVTTWRSLLHENTLPNSVKLVLNLTFARRVIAIGLVMFVKERGCGSSASATSTTVR